MKFCSQCGNAMQDDMLFCQKCGTKFAGVGTQGESGASLKLAKLKGYTLCYDPSVIDWHYINDVGEEGAQELFAKQDKICTEMIGLIGEVFAESEGDSKLREELFGFVFDETEKLLNTAKLMLSDMRVIAQLADGMLSEMGTERFSYASNACDEPYRMIYKVQMVQAVRLKNALELDVIRASKEYRQRTLGIVNLYAEAWEALAARLDTFMVNIATAEDDFLFNWQSINSLADEAKGLWPFYIDLIRGLEPSVIDSLNLDYFTNVPENTNDEDMEILPKLVEILETGIAEIREKEDECYWSAHPEKAAERELLYAKLAALQHELDPLQSRLDELEAEKAECTEKINSMREKIENNEGLIAVANVPFLMREEKKRWKREIEECQARIPELEAKVKTLDEPIRVAKAAAQAKRREVDAVKSAIEELRAR